MLIHVIALIAILIGCVWLSSIVGRWFLIIPAVILIVWGGRLLGLW